MDRPTTVDGAMRMRLEIEMFNAQQLKQETVTPPVQWSRRQTHARRVRPVQHSYKQFLANVSDPFKPPTDKSAQFVVTVSPIQVTTSLAISGNQPFIDKGPLIKEDGSTRTQLERSPNERTRDRYRMYRESTKGVR